MFFLEKIDIYNYLITMEEINYIAGNEVMISLVIRELIGTEHYIQYLSSNDTVQLLKTVLTRKVTYRQDQIQIDY